MSLIKKLFLRRDKYGYPYGPYYEDDRYYSRGKHHHHDDSEHHHHNDSEHHHHDESNDDIPKNNIVPYYEVVKKKQPASDEEIEKILISMEEENADSKKVDNKKETETAVSETKKVASSKDNCKVPSKEPFVPFKKTIHSKLTIVLLEKTNADVDLLSEFLPKIVKEGDVIFILYGDKVDVTEIGKASEIDIKKFFEDGIPTTTCKLYDAVNCIQSIIDKYRFKIFESDKEKILYDSFEIVGVGRCIENGSDITYEEAIKNFSTVYKEARAINKYFCITDKEVINAAKIGFRSIGSLSTEY